MNKLLLGALVLALAACASKEVKEEPKKVEEKPVVQEASKPAEKPVEKPVVQEAPKAAPAPAAVPMPSARSVHFDFDKSTIRDEYKAVVENNARYLGANAGIKVTVEGNCDERGSREYNLALGQRRADSIKKALGVLGVAESRVDTISYGEEKPRCSDHNEACWSQNRRGDIKY
ncbi:MAG: peptidoglycan-associated lipoprotein Pal [Pseudomonadota bacterium]